MGEKLVRDSDLNCNWSIVRPTSIWGHGLIIHIEHSLK